jgi:hypothetical protein
LVGLTTIVIGVSSRGVFNNVLINGENGRSGSVPGDSGIRHGLLRDVGVGEGLL